MNKDSCASEGCASEVTHRALCRSHYDKARYAGTLSMPPKRSESERFWAKVSKSGTCWEWKASHNGEGYGQFGIGSRKVYAHRWAYENAFGPIPDGMTIDHMCHNHACVNPEHLDAVTTAENTRRGSRRAQTRGQVTTTCWSGHAMTEANTYRHGGRHHCRTCRREHTRARYQANKDAINARRRELAAARTARREAVEEA